MEPPKLLPMARKGTGSNGQTIQLLANHFRVKMGKSDFNFYQYDVAMSYEDGKPMEVKGIGRKVLDEVYRTYVELKNVSFAYDGEKGLFTLGPLPKQSLQYTVVLEDVSSRRVVKHGSPDQSLGEGDAKRMRRQSRSKTINVLIQYANTFSMQAIANALRGKNSDNFQGTLRVLDVILRQHAASQGCLLVRQSFFHDSPKNYTEIGGGVLACRGIHSSFRATQGGLSLNVDVSNTMIVKPGPVLVFLVENQNARHVNSIDWNKAKRMLRNLRIKVNGVEFKITGLSDKTCRNQTFVLRQKNGNGEVEETEITVYDYFKIHKNISLGDSADMPCINVGKKRPSYFPIELCNLVSLQRYIKALTVLQRTQLVEKTRQKPQERQQALQNSIRSSRYGDEPMLHSSGIIIDPNLTKVVGRVLQPPKIVVGNQRNIFPHKGRWNFNNKMLFYPVTIHRWAVVNFSCRCDTRNLINLIMRCAKAKGMNLDYPYKDIFEEDKRFIHDPPHVRVEKMYAMLDRDLPGDPQLLLCILPEKKNCDIYGPWKRKCLVEKGVVTQCISPQNRVNDQYITNVLLKINAKFGGMNSFLTTERYEWVPYVSDVPTLILGMDVSHGSPGQSDVPSIAAVVSSKYWPQFSCYRATVRTQSSKEEMIQSLFKPVSDTNEDEGIIREVIMNFKAEGNKRPQQIIIFRDGVSESQFNQVLNIELSEIIKACKHLDENWDPKFTMIIAQKNHHTRFFQDKSRDNVPPGTVIDNTICDPKSNDFYLCAQAGMIGTTRPIHYHVLHDEIGFTADEVQELVHSLSYTYQRSTTAVSLVAPICYAHLAAAQMAQFMKFDENFETSSSHGGVRSDAAPLVPPLPRLHKAVINSMFFC